MTDEAEAGAVSRELRAWLVLGAAAVVVLVVVLMLNTRLTRRLIEAGQAGQAGRQVSDGGGSFERQQQPGQPAQHPYQPPGPHVAAVDHVDHGGSVNGQDPDAREPAPIVSPGDERARPPHRGAFDGD